MRRPAIQAKPAQPRAAAPVRPRLRFPAWLMAVLLVLLVLLTIAVYWPATRGGFINFDDPVNLTANVHVRKGLTWEGIKWAWFKPAEEPGWQPATMMSHMAVCQAFGLNPGAHHLANVLLHALNAGLVFLLLRQMTGAVWRSLLVAALFAVHPLRVEAVAWVTERRELLSAFFGLLTLIAYAGYAEKSAAGGQWPKASIWWSVFRGPGSGFYILTLVLWHLGMMSKPTLVTWPFVMLLLDCWPLRRFELTAINSQLPTIWRLVKEKIPFFVITAAMCIGTFVVEKLQGYLAAGERVPLGARTGNALISYCRYLEKMFWPADLAVFYPHPGYWPLGRVLLAGGLLLGISALFWVQRRRYPFLLIGWFWYCGTLVPMSQIIQTGIHAMADRNTYLPSLGVLIFTVWGACELTRHWRYQVLAGSVAGGAAIVLCVPLTRQQIGYWRESETLFRHALAVTENNALAFNNLGAALGKKGQTDEAIRQYQEAIRLKPADAEVRNNLGAVLDEKGQTDEAIREYQEAIRLKPGYLLAHNNLGVALGKKGQTDEAIREFQEVIRLDPNYAVAYNNLGAALDKQGRTAEAIRQYREAIRLNPDDADAHNNLGTTFDDKGQMDEAIRQYQEAIRLKPDDAGAHNNLGIALGRQGRTEGAIRQFQEALRLKPGHADAHYNLGVALCQQGQTTEAIRQLQEAIRLKPDHAEAHNNLGTAFYQQGRTDEAIGQFQEALRLKSDYADARDNLDVVLAAKAHASPPPGADTKP